MEKIQKCQGPAKYRITVKGVLGNQWLNWFAGMSIESKGSSTIITGLVPDQSALHGLIAKVRDLGLPLIRVERLGENRKKENPQKD
ncbi:MAG TPA: hypothetical protein DHV36_20240 [Desulfobacteraceae bacterium]|nr:hypothetical protein [Desulfobacteraceae bacterium]